MQLRRTSAKAAITFGIFALLAWGIAGPSPVSPPTPPDTSPLLTSAQLSDMPTPEELARLAPSLQVPSPAAAASVEKVSETLKVGHGDTLMDVLQRAGVSRGQAQQAVEALGEVYNPRHLKVGQLIRVSLRQDSAPSNGEDSALVGLDLKADMERAVSVLRGDDGSFSAHQVTSRLKLQRVKTSGTIASSLADSAVSAGLPYPVLYQMIQAFSYDVDFQRDIQPGDRFEVLFEQYVDQEGHPARDRGDILYASLTLSGKPLRIFRYADRDGEADYYNEKGESNRKSLMRTPVNGARLSSTFGMRKNPVLGYSMMHKGVDFAAPIGTPILAAGTGTVEVAGRQGAYGNYIKLRHSPELETAYAHMSSFAAGIRAGRHVRQGQIIGYIGTTGRSTGPHLHFEVIREAQQVNPMSVKNLPTGHKLAGVELRTFQAAQKTLEYQYAEAPAVKALAKN